MVKNKDRWSALSMKDRAALIDIYVKSGITDLGEIRKDYNSFGDGGRILDGTEEEQTLSGKKPTLEEFLQAKADSTRNAAFEKSKNRKTGVKIPYKASKEYLEGLLPAIADRREIADTNFIGPSIKRKELVKNGSGNINYYRKTYYNALQEYNDKCDYGYNCIGTATDNYPEDSRTVTNEDFYKNYNKYGFVRIPFTEVKQGDIVQDNNHALIYSGQYEYGSPLFNYSRGGVTEFDYVKDGHYPSKNYIVSRYIGTPELIQQWTDEYEADYNKKYGGKLNKFATGGDTNSTLKLDGLENEQTLSGIRPITDTEKVEYVIRKSKGSTGDMKDPDNWGPLIRMGIAYGKEEVPVGWSVNDIPTKNDYTGAMMEGVGRMTDNNMGFVSTDDLVDELGYTPDDFVDAYTKNTIPFKELGVIEKTGSGEKKILTNAIGGREVPVYQTYKDTLSSRDLKYLYGELEKAIPKKGDTVYNTNSTSPDSPFKIGNSNIYYDGNNHSVVQVKLPDGKTAFKALDYYDFNPDHWGYDVLPKAKEALQFLDDKGNPYVMTTPWYLQEDTRSIEDRLLDYGIEYNSDGTLHIGRDANGKKWSYEEALADIEKHPYL